MDMLRRNIIEATKLSFVVNPLFRWTLDHDVGCQNLLVQYVLQSYIRLLGCGSPEQSLHLGLRTLPHNVTEHVLAVRTDLCWRVHNVATNHTRHLVVLSNQLQSGCISLTQPLDAHDDVQLNWVMLHYQSCTFVWKFDNKIWTIFCWLQ